jgi:hypothetical protein
METTIDRARAVAAATWLRYAHWSSSAFSAIGGAVNDGCYVMFLIQNGRLYKPKLVGVSISIEAIIPL